MRRSFIQGLVVLGLIAPAVLPGCAAPQDESDSSAGALSEDLHERFADLRDVKTDNLARMLVNASAEKVNSLLKVSTAYGSVGITVAPTVVFATQAEDNSVLPEGAKVQALTDIKTDLAQEYGEGEFPTQLANARLAYLATGKDNYYVETGFDLSAQVDLSWSHAGQGFGDQAESTIDIGFTKGKSVKTRVVVATPSSRLKDLLAVNGEAIMAMRGFVLPEKTEHIRAMKPGEMVSLTGTGTFGANFGVGVPILVATAGPFAYTIAVSAGLSHVVTGVLDVQLVRLANDQVAVEVGVSHGVLDERSLGISGSFGVNTLCGDGARCLNGAIGGIVKNGLTSKLNDFLQTSVKASSSASDNRIQLARMRFHLDQPEVPAALTQALHGDLRYAQALYTRNLEKADPPVNFDFDMMRASTTSMRSFGAQVFGISIYQRSSGTAKGSSAVQTPSGVQSVVWSSFQKSSGFFQTGHDQKLTAVSSAALTTKNPDVAVNEANLIGQSVVGDKALDDDVILDGADGLITMLAGPETLAPLVRYGDAMEQAIDRFCPATGANGKWDEDDCNVKLLSNSAAVNVDGGAMSPLDARTQGLAAFTAQPRIASLGPSQRDLVTKAAQLRLTLQMVKIHNTDSLNGPAVSFALDYRLDDKALGLLARADVDTLKEGVKRYLSAVAGARVGIAGGKSIDDATSQRAADDMGAALVRFKRRYAALASVESSDLPRVLGQKPYIKLPIGIRFDVSDVADADGTDRMKQYLSDAKRIRVESTSHQRALLAVDLINALGAAAKNTVGFGNFDHRMFAEQAAAYTVIGLVPASNLEVGIDVGTSVKVPAWAKRERFKAAGFLAFTTSSRGDQVKPITGNMFDLDAMMSK